MLNRDGPAIFKAVVVKNFCLPSLTPFQCVEPVGGCACLRLAPAVQLPLEQVPAQQLLV